MPLQSPPQPEAPITPEASAGAEGVQALIEEARQRTRRRRQGNAAVALLAALVGLLVVLLLASGGATRKHKAARSPSSAGLATPPHSFGSGEFWYMRTVSTLRESRPAGGEYQAKVFMRARGPMVPFRVRLASETWVGVDGTVRQRTTVISQGFASARGRAEWAAYHRRVPNFSRDLNGQTLTQGDGKFPPTGPSGDPLGPQDIGDGAFTYAQLLALPHQPTPLIAAVGRAFNALGQREARTSLNPCGWGGTAGCPRGASVPAWQRRDSAASTDLAQIAQLLTWPVPARLRLSLFRAATTLRALSTNVTVVPHVRDPLGRPGTEVSIRTPRYPGYFVPDPTRVIFDPTNGTLLSNAGQVLEAQGVTNSVWTLPWHVEPLRASGQPPSPPIVSISPATGSRSTIFTVTVRSISAVPAPHPGVWFGGGVSGPVYPGCRSGFSRPAPPSPPPWLHPAARSSSGAYVYRLTAPSGTGNHWCSGRYELNITSSGLGPAGASDLGTSTSYFVVS